MKSVMTHSFALTPKVKLPRSSFDRSHGNKFSFDAGFLIPIYVDEVLPGDTFNLKLSAFARLNTPIFPIMDNLHLDTFFFEVPIRQVWNSWKKFNGEQTDPADSIDFTIPTCTGPAVSGYANETIYDYLGIPTKIPEVIHSSLPQRCYNLIWNEWFRDENLQDSVVVDLDDGPDDHTDYALLRRGKRHDYFTSCLPWPQKQTLPVSIPLGTRADVVADSADGAVVGVYSTTNAKYQALLTDGGVGDRVEFDTFETTKALSMYADLTTAADVTINELRQSFQIQSLLERDARGGTRYTEIILSHWGVSSPDARQFRPIYLGGGSTPINVSPIAQTSSTDVTSPQGNLAAMATAAISGHGFTQSFTEHSIIIGLCSVRADITYQQGLPRMYSRSTRYDHYWPSLAVIGEQTVLNREIWAQGSDDYATDALPFGYQERYAEYRFKNSQIGGKFRSNDAASLDPWHLSQDFSVLPTLGDTFIQDTPPIDRIVAVTTEPDMIFDSYFKLICARAMPMTGIPATLGRM